MRNSQRNRRRGSKISAHARESQEIESHYAAGSEAKFNLWLAGMHIGYIHPCLKSSTVCAGKVQQGVESMR